MATVKPEIMLMFDREPFRQMGWTVVDHAKYETGEKLGYWSVLFMAGATHLPGGLGARYSVYQCREVLTRQVPDRSGRRHPL